MFTLKQELFIHQEHWLYVKMKSLQKGQKPKHFHRPLLVGYSVGHKLLSLNNIKLGKKSLCSFNELFDAIKGAKRHHWHAEHNFILRLGVPLNILALFIADAPSIFIYDDYQELHKSRGAHTEQPETSDGKTKSHSLCKIRSRSECWSEQL